VIFGKAALTRIGARIFATTRTPDMHNSWPDLATILRDPVCGMTIDSPSQSQSLSHEHDGHNYTFCSSRCMDTFAAAPETYIAAEDPVCGMMVDRASARHTSRHAGQRFYFCSSRDARINSKVTPINI
jgi:Cu+-exporting ATPase